MTLTALQLPIKNFCPNDCLRNGVLTVSESVLMSTATTQLQVPSTLLFSLLICLSQVR